MREALEALVRRHLAAENAHDMAETGHAARGEGQYRGQLGVEKLPSVPRA